MFSIFKPKKYLTDLFDNHTDIHNHLIPGIDDGSDSVEQSLELIDAMRGLGITDFIATPHTMGEIYPNTPQIINSAAYDLNKALTARGDTHQVRTASEYMLDEQFSSRLQHEELLPLKDNYILVEISYLQPPIYLEDLLFEIIHAGYIPVLAHPERYSYYHKKYDYYNELQRLGCLFQLNALSLGDHYGHNVHLMARKLLEDGRYTFIGTDTHHIHHLKSLKKITYKEKMKPAIKTLIEVTKNTFSLPQ